MKSDLQSYFLMYFLAINVLSFLMVGVDKLKAKRKRWRIPESRFFAFGVLGGAPGVYLGMQLFRHKTQHRKFTIGIPVLIILNVTYLYYLRLW